jgi:hypothetical protein
MLTFPPSWGPTEWGPIPYLPAEDVLVKRMEAQWGSLHAYRCVRMLSNGFMVKMHALPVHLCLCEEDVLVKCMEAQWGTLHAYRCVVMHGV